MRHCASISFSTGSIFDDKLKNMLLNNYKQNSLDMTKKPQQKIKMSTKLYLLFTVVKDNKKKMYISVQKDANIWKSLSQTLSPFQPYELQWEGKRC